MRRVCTIFIRVFALFWLLAFLLFLVGTFGLFGQERGPLAGIFLIPLGMPWNRMLMGLPEGLRPWAGVLAPGINLILLAAVRRFMGRRS